MSGDSTMKIVRDRHLVDDPWQPVGTEEPLPGGAIIVPVARWHEALAAGRDEDSLGVVLPAGAEPSELDGLLEALPLVAVHFESPGDGRGYSLARTLRERGFGGDLRACGMFGRDQVFYLARCGFTSFAPEAIEDLTSLLAGFDDFSLVYQPAADVRDPIDALRAARAGNPAR